MTTRRFPRFPLDRPLTVVAYWDDVQVRKIHGRCEVISERGLGARLSDHLHVGDVVRLDMAPLPSVYAKVRNHIGSRYGFEFVYFLNGPEKALASLCAPSDAKPDSPPASH